MATDGYEYEGSPPRSPQPGVRRATDEPNAPLMRPVSAFSYSSGPRRLALPPTAGNASYSGWAVRPHSAAAGEPQAQGASGKRSSPFQGLTSGRSLGADAVGGDAVSPRVEFWADNMRGLRSPITVAFNKRGREILRMYERSDARRDTSDHNRRQGGGDTTELFRNFDATYDKVSRLLASQTSKRGDEDIVAEDLKESADYAPRAQNNRGSGSARRLYAQANKGPVAAVHKHRKRNIQAIVASIEERRVRENDEKLKELDKLEPEDALRAMQKQRWVNPQGKDHMQRNKMNVRTFSNAGKIKAIEESARVQDRRIVEAQQRSNAQLEARRIAVEEKYVQKMNREYYTALRLKQEAAVELRTERKLQWTVICHLMIRMEFLQKHLETDRKVRAKRKSMKWAVGVIMNWYARILRKRRMEYSKGMVAVLMYHLRRWVKKMLKKIRSDAAHRLIDFLEDMQNSNKVVFLVRTFRQRVLKIQECWRGVFLIRKAQHKLAVLQWNRFEAILRGGVAARNARLLLSGEGRGKGYLFETEKMALEIMSNNPALSATLGVRIPRDLKELVIAANMMQQRKDVIARLPVYAELMEVYKAQLQLDDVRRSLFENLSFSGDFVNTAIKPDRPRVFAIQSIEQMLQTHMDGVGLASARKAEMALVEKAESEKRARGKLKRASSGKGPPPARGGASRRPERASSAR